MQGHNEIDAPSTPGGARTISRRTVMKGAVWSVPVVALSAPVPAFAVSGCPDLSSATVWSRPAVTAGSTVDNNYGWGIGTSANGYPLGANLFTEVSDTAIQTNSSAAAWQQGVNTTIVTSATLSVIAGKTYTFTFSASAEYGYNDATRSFPQTVSLSVGGTNIWQGNTRQTQPSSGAAPLSGYVQIPVANSFSQATPQTFTATFDASTTGNVQVSYTFVFAARNVNASTSDDISISTPSISCS